MLGVDQFASGIPGEYQIERVLGQSELGSAYLAYQPTHGRHVMITTFNLPRWIADGDYEQLRSSLVREAEVLTRLAHPHIMPIYSLGLQPRYLYLTTAFVKVPSLGQFLKQNVRFTPEQTLIILKQLASGLEYAHSQGVTHGTLSLSNVMVTDELHMRIAGFGIHSMFAVLGNPQRNQTLAHLTSEHGTFLGSPVYLSPERVLGQVIDPRSDIYALGVMLFELLSGSKLFTGTNPLEVALQRLQQPLPSISAVCPEVPAAFDLLFGNMLERDPARRTQYVGDAVATFERILKTLNPETSATMLAAEYQTLGSDVTLPPTVNWFDEPFNQGEAGNASFSQPPVPNEASTQLPAPTRPDLNSLGGVDPFAWWTNTSTGLRAAPSPSRTPGTFSQHTSTRLNNSKASPRQRTVRQDRRKLVKSIIIGSATVGTLTLGSISFAHFVQSMKQSQVASNASPTNGTTPGVSKTPAGQTQPTPGKKGSPTAHPTQQPTPTQQKQPTPTPVPAHTGTVIGSTNQAVNTAVIFKNPATGVSSLLIRLANGNFEACERTCTHEPSPANLVNYIAGNQTLKCPTHGAIFNTQNNFAHLSGPGHGSLQSIAIRVNADGTITTG